MSPSWSRVSCGLMNRKGETRVIGSAQTWAEALEAVRTLRPDVLLADYRMPGGDAAGLTEVVLAEHPETKVIVRDRHRGTGEPRCGALPPGARE